MFIYSIKAQSIKLFLSITLSVLSVITIMMIFPISNYDKDESMAVSKSIEEKNFKNIETSEDRINFLKQYGWDIEPNPRDIQQVTIPIKFDSLYEKYNNLQLKEGLDLEKYKGKTVKKYTYLVSNYEYDGIVYANLLIYKNRVIGGDICSAISDGFMHGFSKDNLFQT